MDTSLVERLAAAERLVDSEHEERVRLERLVWRGYERDKLQLKHMLENGTLTPGGYEIACRDAADRWEIALLGTATED